MIEAPHYSPAGAKKSAGFSLPETYFDGTVNEPVLHQAVTSFMANQRQGTAKTKTRSFVSGGNQKPWKQKGTGRARAGTTRSPLWPGGGTTFGPIPRDYRQDIPRKVKQLARKSALNARASEGALHVVERFELQSPKTARLVELLATMGLDGRKTLILTHGISEALVMSARNVPHVDVLPYHEASAYDVLWAESVLVEEGALGDEPAVPFVRPFTPAPKTVPVVRAPRVKSDKPKAEKPKVEKAHAAKAEKPKAEKKTATKKSAAKAKPRTAKPEAKKSTPKSQAAKKPAPNKKKGGK